jgi:hypothetical protein
MSFKDNVVDFSMHLPQAALAFLASVPNIPAYFGEVG